MASSSARSRRFPVFSKSPVALAVLAALYGAPRGVHAQDQADASTDTLGEVIVTANRRNQTTEEVPYSISVVTPAQIANSGVTDLASLSRQVPGVSMRDTGARTTGNVFPIIRGLNASPGAGGFRTFEQSPVGMYINNSPIDGYFQLDDIERIEVLRGPQGTLYGAGALGGALRIIPNAPDFSGFTGSIEGKGGFVDSAGDGSYSGTGMVNVPLGETLAFRVSANYEYLPGFINAFGIMTLDETGDPVLADPSDPVNSPGIFEEREDWNYQKTFTGRASVRWEPTQSFSAQFAYLYSDLKGEAGRVTTPDFPGGPFVADPRINFPAGGNYQTFAGVDEPYDRETDLASLDLSYDAGFATLSSTTSYFTTDGATQSDISYGLYRLPQYLGYYTGVTLNPRLIFPQTFADKNRTFSQELRLVSNSEPGDRFDYVVGLFYEKQTRNGDWVVTAPGSQTRALAEGCTAPYFFGASFPDCIPLTGPDELLILQDDEQKFEDKSVFGELTWHYTEKGQITAGVRHFEQKFEDIQSLEVYAFVLSVPEEPRRSDASKTTWKLNTSYEYATNHHAYALWSQGFRRGGSNAIPITGPFGDNPELITYQPDSVNNFEVGIKGHFENGLSYAFDVFRIIWDDPQVGGTTPTTNFAVWNANEAVSEGVELDLSTPLGSSGLSIALSGAYADATFSEDYLINSTFGDIIGTEGQQLPGSPKVSGAVTLNYNRTFGEGYRLALSLNDTYQSKVVLSNFGILGAPPLEAEKINIVNASAAVSSGPWKIGLYATNLLNERVLLTPGNPDPFTNNLSTRGLINQPREIFMRAGYSF